MRVIICGAGQVGYGIAERLAAEKNDVSIIDTAPQLIHAVRDSLDVRGFIGHGSHPDVLEAAGAEVAGNVVVLEVNGLKGRERLEGSPLVVLNQMGARG